ncbi:hypothetical protein [Streptomyces adonidis]|uniref:hypothetical protein n=1 Tax=Streptomyces adonidis TaxID=3231367 RepID=UPI0034DACEE1
MGSLIEELEQRESTARARVAELREQIAELTTLLTSAEQRLSRLEIARETVTEILDETSEHSSTAEETREAEAPPTASRFGEGSPIGVLTVPPRRPGLDSSVLPTAYQDLIEVIADAGRPMRAMQVAEAAGLSVDRSKVEGLRSKLKRLVERGWLAEDGPGRFTLPSGDGRAS